MGLIKEIQFPHGKKMSDYAKDLVIGSHLNTVSELKDGRLMVDDMIVTPSAHVHYATGDKGWPTAVESPSGVVRSHTSRFGKPLSKEKSATDRNTKQRWIVHSDGTFGWTDHNTDTHYQQHKKLGLQQATHPDRSMSMVIGEHLLKSFPPEFEVVGTSKGHRLWFKRDPKTPIPPEQFYSSKVPTLSDGYYLWTSPGDFYFPVKKTGNQITVAGELLNESLAETWFQVPKNWDQMPFSDEELSALLGIPKESIPTAKKQMELRRGTKTADDPGEWAIPEREWPKSILNPEAKVPGTPPTKKQKTNHTGKSSKTVPPISVVGATP